MSYVIENIKGSIVNAYEIDNHCYIILELEFKSSGYHEECVRKTPTLKRVRLERPENSFFYRIIKEIIDSGDRERLQNLEFKLTSENLDLV